MRKKFTLTQLWAMAHIGEKDGFQSTLDMPVWLAKKIKKLRKDCSWRALAYEITDRKDSNQLLGMGLHKKAQKVLNEVFP